jgi:hypothetical protein
VADISTCGIGAGVSETVAVIGWLDASVVGTRGSGAVGLAARLPPWEGIQEAVINTKMENRITVFMLIST